MNRNPLYSALPKSPLNMSQNTEGSLRGFVWPTNISLNTSLTLQPSILRPDDFSISSSLPKMAGPSYFSGDSSSIPTLHHSHNSGTATQGYHLFPSHSSLELSGFRPSSTYPGGAASTAMTTDDTSSATHRMPTLARTVSSEPSGSMFLGFETPRPSSSQSQCQTLAMMTVSNASWLSGFTHPPASPSATVLTAIPTITLITMPIANPVPSPAPHSMEPLPMPADPKTMQAATKGATTIAISVGTICGAAILIALLVYFFLLQKSRRQNLVDVEGRSTRSHRDDSTFDGFRSSSTLRRNASRNTKRSVTVDEIANASDADSIGMSSVEKVQIASAMNWAERPLPLASTSQDSIAQKALPKLPVLTEDAREVTDSCRLDESGSAKSAKEIMVKDNSRTVSPLRNFDPSNPHASQSEYQQVSPPHSPMKNLVQKLAPGQKYWAGLGMNSCD